jgi:hypothetical protein
VPVEVLPPQHHLPPLPNTGTSSAPAISNTSSETFYHPLSGLIILGIDFLGFGSEALSGFLDTPVICILSFIVALLSILFVQTKYRKDESGLAFGKALLGATLAGMPVFIGGGVFGLAVITMSGLPHGKVEAMKLAIESYLGKNKTLKS